MTGKIIKLHAIRRTCSAFDISFATECLPPVRLTDVYADMINMAIINREICPVRDKGAT